MNEQVGTAYYTLRESEILTIFDGQAQGWKLFIVSRYGDTFADTILREAREQFKEQEWPPPFPEEED